MHLCSARWSLEYGFHKTKFIKFFALFLIKNCYWIKKKRHLSAYSLDKKPETFGASCSTDMSSCMHKYIMMKRQNWADRSHLQLSFSSFKIPNQLHLCGKTFNSLIRKRNNSIPMVTLN